MTYDSAHLPRLTCAICGCKTINPLDGDWDTYAVRGITRDGPCHDSCFTVWLGRHPEAAEPGRDLLHVWAELFTDNCSDGDPADLYRHYRSFTHLFHGGGVDVVPPRVFRAFTAENSPMGLHDGEDTDALICRLAAAHPYAYPGVALLKTAR